MYLTKHEIIVTLTLVSYVFFGGISSIIIFCASFIYLQFINKKMRYHIIKNDNQDAMMLEGGMSQRKTKFIKFSGIVLLWIIVWYFGDANRDMIEVFKKDNITYEPSFVQNFVEFWVFLTQLICFILTCDIAYRLFNSSVNSDDYTKREIMLAGTLLLDAGFGAYYFYNWFLFSDHQEFFDANMTSVIVTIIIFAAIAASSLWIIVYGKNDEDAKDERDLLIEVKAYKTGFYVMQAGIGLLIGQMILENMAFSLFSDRVLSLTHVEVVNLLLLVSIVAHLAVCGAQLFFYRRGY